MENKSRREFLVLAAVTGASAVVFAACGKSDSNNGGGTPQTQGVCTDGAGTAYTNVSHPHTTITMTGAQITAAAPGIYTLLGGSHDHSFEFFAADFVSLKNGDAIQKQDLEGHGHTIEVAC